MFEIFQAPLKKIFSKGRRMILCYNWTYCALWPLIAELHKHVTPETSLQDIQQASFLLFFLPSLYLQVLTVPSCFTLHIYISQLRYQMCLVTFIHAMSCHYKGSHAISCHVILSYVMIYFVLLHMGYIVAMCCYVMS